MRECNDTAVMQCSFDGAERKPEMMEEKRKAEQKAKGQVKRRTLLEAALLLAGMVSFWGFLYPELSLSEDVEIRSFIKEVFDDKQKCAHWRF